MFIKRKPKRNLFFCFCFSYKCYVRQMCWRTQTQMQEGHYPRRALIKACIVTENWQWGLSKCNTNYTPHLFLGMLLARWECWSDISLWNRKIADLSRRWRAGTSWRSAGPNPSSPSGTEAPGIRYDKPEHDGPSTDEEKVDLWGDPEENLLRLLIYYWYRGKDPNEQQLIWWFQRRQRAPESEVAISWQHP